MQISATMERVRCSLAGGMVACCLLSITVPVSQAVESSPTVVRSKIRRAVDTEPTSPMWGEERPPVVRDRESAIRDDLVHKPAERWAGDYFAYQLEVIVSRAGAVAIRRGHMGIEATNEGEVILAANGSLDISWNRPNTDEYARFPVRLVPVRWGDRRYLLEPERIGNFVDQINSGYEPRTLYGGSALIADGDIYRSVDDDPQLPENFRRDIRTGPLTAHILEVQVLPNLGSGVDGSCKKKYRLRLSVAGGEAKVGDAFRPVYPPEFDAEIDVKGVTSREIFAVTSIDDPNCQVPVTIPNRAWVLQTHVFDRDSANRKIELQRREDLPDGKAH